MSFRIGIDLGTTFSAVAYMDKQGEPVIIRNQDGSTITPSVIYFGEDSIIVGEEAKERQAFSETEVASFFKRSVGDDAFVQYFNDQTYSTCDLSSILLKHLKQMAEDELQTDVTEAVITVPAYYDNRKREETIEAGKRAGLHVKAIINEPTAAALAYGINAKVDQHLVVYDLGGGTYDVTVVEVSAEKIKVLATGGDHSLGGKDWDDRILTYVADQFEQTHGIDPFDDLETMNELIIKGEQAKKTLTQRTTTDIVIVCGGIKETYTITRNLFEELTKDLMERTWNLTNTTLEEAGLSWQNISDVLLVGGSTRMPQVHTYIEETIGKPPLKGVNPDEAVAIGAVIKANLPEEEADEQIFSLGSTKQIEDVMSHSLGMVVVNERNTKYINSIIIRKNEPIPTERKRPYQLQTRPGNNQMEVYITQGESQKPTDCSIIGKYVVKEIAHQSNGLAKIDVIYAYDENGIVQVSAFDKIEKVTLPVQRVDVADYLDWLDGAPEDEVMEQENLSVVIALDLSYSMNGEPLEEAQLAAKEFVNNTDFAHSSISLLGFADRTKQMTPLSNDREHLIHTTDAYLDVFNSAQLGYGNGDEPFSEAYDTLHEQDGKKYVIVLTDGMWNDPETAKQKAKECHVAGIEIVAIGFGGANQAFLEEIATTSEHALFTDVNELVSSFSKIAQELHDTSNHYPQKKAGLLRIFK